MKGTSAKLSGSKPLPQAGLDWFVGPGFDLWLFFIPVWLCWVIAFSLSPTTRDLALPVWVWVVAVLLIDVGHVWSSLYRTYLDPTARRHHGVLLRWLPLLCFFGCFCLALRSEQLFWRVLAYVAVFHFIKQQVGFAALYRYKFMRNQMAKLPEKDWGLLAKLDKWTIYAGTFGPVLYWHLQPEKKISWFIPGDFIPLDSVFALLGTLPGASFLLGMIKIGLMALWFGLPLLWLTAHVRAVKQFGISFPVIKVMWIASTWVNWYLGIVYFDSDLIFTLTNVVAHGVPYFALIGLVAHRKLKRRGYGKMPQPPSGRWARAGFYLAFLCPLLILAWTEEYFWNQWLYRDYASFFSLVLAFPVAVLESSVWRALAIGLLALPQTVHYILDGFIWKMNHKNPDLKPLLFEN